MERVYFKVETNGGELRESFYDVDNFSDWQSHLLDNVFVKKEKGYYTYFTEFDVDVAWLCIEGENLLDHKEEVTELANEYISDVNEELKPFKCTKEVCVFWFDSIWTEPGTGSVTYQNFELYEVEIEDGDWDGV